jgi:IS5 family transposase
VKLAGVVDWTKFDAAFEPLFDEQTRRPAIPTRVMVGLHYLKHLQGWSDEEVVEQWVENPYWQYLCGSKYFEHRLPIHPTSMTKWRKKIAAAGAEKLLQETLAAGLQLKALKAADLQRVVVDTTVQERAVAFPTDAKLYDDMRRKLVRMAQQQGLVLRQSYRRCGKRMLHAVGRSTRGHHLAGIRKHTRKLKTYLGRVLRDIERKLPEQEHNDDWQPVLKLAWRLFQQQRTRFQQALQRACSRDRMYRQRQAEKAIRVRAQSGHRHHSQESVRAGGLGTATQTLRWAHAGLLP